MTKKSPSYRYSNWFFASDPISSVERCDRPAGLPQNACEASSANSTFAGEIAFPAPTEQTEQPRSDSLCLAPSSQNSKWHGDNDREPALPGGQRTAQPNTGLLPPDAVSCPSSKTRPLVLSPLRLRH